LWCPVPHFVKVLLDNESTPALTTSTPPKCTIYPFLLTQVQAIHYSVRVTVFNATFNNISGISWRSVLLVEETGEYHRSAASHWQTLSHNVASSTPRHARTNRI
jgi:hypothetical protein